MLTGVCALTSDHAPSLKILGWPLLEKASKFWCSEQSNKFIDEHYFPSISYKFESIFFYNIIVDAPYVTSESEGERSTPPFLNFPESPFDAPRDEKGVTVLLTLTQTVVLAPCHVTPVW